MLRHPPVNIFTTFRENGLGESLWRFFILARLYSRKTPTVWSWAILRRVFALEQPESKDVSRVSCPCRGMHHEHFVSQPDVRQYFIRRPPYVEPMVIYNRAQYFVACINNNAIIALANERHQLFAHNVERTNDATRRRVTASDQTPRRQRASCRKISSAI